MLIKVDLEKAYDCLRWEFVKATLMNIGIPDNIIKLVDCWMIEIRWTTKSVIWSNTVVFCIDHPIFCNLVEHPVT